MRRAAGAASRRGLVGKGGKGVEPALHCPHCGGPVPPGRGRCPRCGLDLNPHAPAANPIERTQAIGALLRGAARRGPGWRAATRALALLVLAELLWALWTALRG